MKKQRKHYTPEEKVALGQRIAVSLPVDLIQLLREPGQRQLAIAVLGPLFHGRGPHPGRKMRHTHC